MLLDEQLLEHLIQYIWQGWSVLRRSNRQLVIAAADPTIAGDRDRWLVYVSQQENLDHIREHLSQQMSPDDFEKIELSQLPIDYSELRDHGLLYVPYDYCVPGENRFGTLFAWDSKWIISGLLHHGKINLAKGMVDDFLYEIQHYGRILNSNFTTYLTRSQPPLLTGMILAVFKHTRDRAWLQATLPFIEDLYQYWLSESHLTPETGLSRYYDLGSGPAPEVEAGERDEQGRTHYQRVQKFFYDAPTFEYGYDLTRFYNRSEDSLTPLFYIGDRSMRESGFDPSDRFGRFNIGVIDYNPVCLNSLLYLMEQETAEILRILGDRNAAHQWQDRADRRISAINQHLWNDEAGLYFDYSFRDGNQRHYPFLTTFYPLWAGIASAAQAEKVVANLPLFEAPGGLQTSTHISGSQWDAPFGWAPLQMIAVKGLRNYGYVREANRISLNFISLVLQEFVEHGAIFEKYDVVRCTSQTSSGQLFGYTENVVGFGWTNGVVLELLADLSKSSYLRV